MIWYLLYPIRGTTEAPVLPQSHPIRSAFTRYGRYVSQNVVSTLLVWSTVAVVLLYPIPFLFTTDFINGASNLPHHVWTAAQPLPKDAVAQPDIIMRSFWVHGGYMDALNPRLLSEALELQDELLGTTQDFNPRRSAGLVSTTNLSQVVNLNPRQRDSVHVSNGLTNQSWFFHSPLLYWGCSQSRILNDADIVGTVNDRKNQSTSVNVTLRHSIVFSGERFEDRRLLAADALVITLLHLRDSPVGRHWEQKTMQLPAKIGNKWDMYPSSGRISASQLYEFQFRPMSLKDITILTAAYTFTLLYFMASLAKLRAFNSKVGLTVAVLTQMTVSIMSSFTVCAVLNIDLSRMPHYAYPVALFAVGIESVFRLINAVIRTPAQDSTSTRIGYAYGETALTSLASTIQNVLILLALSRTVSAGVEAFCYFAAIAILFNFFYLSTFFLPVLSVDVRRTELEDALTKATNLHKRKMTDHRTSSSWVTQLLHGRTALSTRVAGTLITVAFVLMAQWHFLEDGNLLQLFTRLYKGRESPRAYPLDDASTLDAIHQASSPTSWVRQQDHDTAREVINIIKPHAHTYIAKVYDPLVFVMKNADRTPRSREPALMPAVYDFLRHELTRFLAVIVIVVSALRLLCSYLLWEDETTKDDGADRSPLLVVRSVSGQHRLDIVLLTSSADGHVVTMGLDRLINVWDARTGGSSYSLPSEDLLDNDAKRLPVISIAIDGDSRWLALLCPSKIILWDLKSRRCGSHISIEAGVQKPLIFQFYERSVTPGTVDARLLLLERNGTLCDFAIDHDEEFEDAHICSDTMTDAAVAVFGGPDSDASELCLAATSEKGKLFLIRRKDDEWIPHEVVMPDLGGQLVHQVVRLPGWGLFLAATSRTVSIVDGCSGNVSHTFSVDAMHPRSLKSACSFHRLSKTGFTGVTSLTLGYIARESGECVLETFSPSENSDAIWTHTQNKETGGGWETWEDAQHALRRLAKPGAWELLSDGSVLGIRRNQAAFYESHKMGQSGHCAEGLRFRPPHVPNSREMFLEWEMWTASPPGRLEADERQPLFDGVLRDGHLMICELGPKTKVGLNSVAFAFGNVVKLVTLGGTERWENVNGDMAPGTSMNWTGRRRKTGSVLRTGPDGAGSWSS